MVAIVQVALATVFEHHQMFVMYHTAPEYVCATTVIIDLGDLGIHMGVLVTYMAMCTTHARTVTIRTETGVT